MGCDLEPAPVMPQPCVAPAAPRQSSKSPLLYFKAIRVDCIGSWYARRLTLVTLLHRIGVGYASVDQRASRHDVAVPPSSCSCPA